MSTKTSIKRIALVAASALAIGGFSAVSPAHAVAASFTISNKSASAKVVACAQTLTSTASTTITSGGGVCLSDALTPLGTGIWGAGGDNGGFFGTILTNTTPGGGTAATLAAASPTQTVTPTSWYKGTVASTTVASGVIANTITGMTVAASANAGLLLTLDAAGANTTAKARITIGGTTISSATVTAVATDTSIFVPFTAPVTAGTYTASVQYSVGGLYTGTGADTFTQPFTLTVTALSAHSASQAILAQGAPAATGDAQGATAFATPANYGSTSDALTYTVSKTLTTQSSSIEVILRNADATAATQKNIVSASVTGPGLVLVDQTNGAAAGTGRSSSFTPTGTNNVYWVHVSADGSAGVGTVTISVTDAVTGTSTVLGTRTQTYVGSVGAIKVASTNFNIGYAGKVTGKSIGTRVAAKELGAALANDNTVETMPAFVVATTDGTNPASISAANGTVPTIASSDTTVVVSGLCLADDGAVAISQGQGGAVGFYNCQFTSASNAVSGSKATLTISTPSSTAGVNLTTTYAVTIGGKVATEVITTDASSYAPGNQMLVTVTAKDSAGNPVADGIASPAVTANRALGSSNSALAAGYYLGGTTANASSVAKSSLFAPSITGEFTLKATSGNTAGDTITAKASVDGGVGDTTSSLALDAANAATDAANNAYDEAQNATQAASDALAAVTALSAQVEALIATVKSLAAMVAKIKAKVKA